MKRMLSLLLCMVIFGGMTACNRELGSGPEITIGLGEDYLDSGDYEAALEQFQRYIGLEPDDEFGYLYAAEAYIGMNDSDQAAAILLDGYDRTASERIQLQLDSLPDSLVAATAPDLSSAPASSSPPASADTLEAMENDALQDGEFLYTGSLYCPQAEGFRVSFILSEDLSYIHDFKMELTNFNASIQNGDETTTVEASSMTETLNGEFDIDFDGDNYDIPVGNSTIRYLYFDGDTAYMELDYVYYSSNSYSGIPIEIPIDTSYGDLSTDVAPDDFHAPEPASDDRSSESDYGETSFSYELLENWIDDLPGGVYNFEPASPMARHYIVCAESVIDPVTGQESMGGYEFNYTRHEPVDRNDVLFQSGNLSDGGLILTDDPDLATYALIIDFAYDHTGTFSFDDGTSVVQYHGTTTAELYNMVTGDSISTGNLTTYATYANESVYNAMLDNAKGKQLYAQSSSITSDNFEGYWDFIE